MLRFGWGLSGLLGVLLAACAASDPQHYLDTELAFLKTGVRLEEEEREVRRVFAQRGLRVVARLADPLFVALGGAARRGEQSAVRIVTQRGVVLAEDASHQDLFHPGTVALIEHFGGSIGPYVLAASARVPLGRDLGCVSLHRVVADGRVVSCTVDIGLLGSFACVANVAPAASGRIRATIAWPALHALTTPSVEVELAIVEPLVGRAVPLVPLIKLANQGEWLERERARLSTIRLSRAPFSERHAVGVARAALASVAGVPTAQQVASYRESVQTVLPGSAEADIVALTIAHIARGWNEPQPLEEAEEESTPQRDDVQTIEPDAEPGVEDDQGTTVIEPDAP